MLDKISAHCSSNHYCNLARNIISENPKTAIITIAALFALSGIAIFCYNSHTLQGRDVENFTDPIERARTEALKKELNVIKDQHGRIEIDIITKVKFIPREQSLIDPTFIQKAASIAIKNNTSLTFGKKDPNSVLDFLNLNFPCLLIIPNGVEKVFTFYSAIGFLLATKFNDDDLMEAFKDVNEASGLAIVEKYQQEIVNDWSDSKIKTLKTILNEKFSLAEFIAALFSTKNAHLKFVGTSADFPNNEIGEALMEIRGELATKILNENDDLYNLKYLAKKAEGIVPDPAK